MLGKGMITLVIVAVSFFLTMSLMRWTLRRSRNLRGDGIRWRGIDWSGVKKDEPVADGVSANHGASASHGAPSENAEPPAT